MNRILLVASIVLFCGLFVGLGVTWANDELPAESDAIKSVVQIAVDAADLTSPPALQRDGINVPNESDQFELPSRRVESAESIAAAHTEERNQPPSIDAKAAQAGVVGINGAACNYSSIGQAIANATSGDTIFIEHGTYNELLGELGKAYTFVPARPSSNCQQEDLGADSNDVIIDGNGGSDDGTGGLVEVTGGVEVTFRHMWLRNATATNGGIIAVTGAESRVTLDDVLVTDGDATASGGNIYAQGAGLTSETRAVVVLLNDSSVYRGNTTLGDGGAIALFGATLIVSDGNIGVSSNNGFSTAGNNGGGVYAKDSFVELYTDQSKVIWNEAGNFGGGIYADDSQININDTTISDNQTRYSGGGIYIEGDSSLNINGATFDGNSNTDSLTNMGGGAIHARSVDVTIGDSLFTNNSAINSGGAIYGRDNSTITLTNGTIISGNMATSGGAGLMIWRHLIMDNSQVINNVSGGSGGGIYCFVCHSMAINQNSIVSLNTGDDGGGLFVFGVSTLPTIVNLDGANVSLNRAILSSPDRGLGGGIRIIDSHLNIENSLLFANEARLSGGGIYGSILSSVHGRNFISITNSTVSHNETTTFQTNQGGGGMYIEDDESQVYMDGAIFRNNHSVNIGGGLEMRTGPSSIIRNSTFEDNTAGLGAGIYATFGEHIVENSFFSGNNSTGSGGALYFNSTDLVTLRNNEVFGNIADYGAGLYLWFNEALLENNKFNFNQARNNGGGMYVNGATVRITTKDVNCATGFFGRIPPKLRTILICR